MVLVIDSGTTNTKAFLFDGTGKPVCESRCLTRTLHPDPGMVEQEAEEWWRAARCSLLFKKYGARKAVYQK